MHIASSYHTNVHYVPTCAERAEYTPESCQKRKKKYPLRSLTILAGGRESHVVRRASKRKGDNRKYTEEKARSWLRCRSGGRGFVGLDFGLSACLVSFGITLERESVILLYVLILELVTHRFFPFLLCLLSLCSSCFGYACYWPSHSAHTTHTHYYYPFSIVKLAQCEFCRSLKLFENALQSQIFNLGRGGWVDESMWDFQSIASFISMESITLP